MRLVLISDTHRRHADLVVPSGDVLIHAGDFSGSGTRAQVRDAAAFIRALPHRHKIVIAGNHDRCLELDPALGALLFEGCHYLFDGGVTIDGTRFWGSPWQPWFLDWAFNLKRGEALREKWALIPEGTDVLITHGPPAGVLDLVFDGSRAGCADLRAAVHRVRPQLHVFGHIHEGYGVHEEEETRYVNASSCTLAYVASNPAIIVDVLPRAALTGNAGTCQSCATSYASGTGNATFPDEKWFIVQAFQHPVGTHGGESGMTGTAQCKSCGGRALFSCSDGPGYTFSGH